MQSPLTPITLTGRYVELQPLSANHVEDLRLAVGELWKSKVTPVPHPSTMAEYVQNLLALRDRGEVLPFAIVHRNTGKAVGSTRYMAIRAKDRGLEIGGTWIGVPWQRTPVNTEAKYLLLGYAFEQLGCLRVELKTHILNHTSRSAIERLGARQEGIFRKHMIMPDGSLRDTVYYSLLDEEWPEVKARLAGWLDK